MNGDGTLSVPDLSPKTQTGVDLGVIVAGFADGSPLVSHRLQKNLIGPKGAQQMADALKQNKSLKELM